MWCVCVSVCLCCVGSEVVVCRTSLAGSLEPPPTTDGSEMKCARERASEPQAGAQAQCARDLHSRGGGGGGSPGQALQNRTAAAAATAALYMRKGAKYFAGERERERGKPRPRPVAVRE